MPKPSREPRGRKNEWESLPESKSEVESYLNNRKETPKQIEQKYVWSYLPESLQEIEDRRQKQYQDLQTQRANIIPTATGNMDAEYAGYNKALAEYGAYWGDKGAYNEGFAGYNAAMDRVRGQYDSHEARHSESDRKVEERIARTSGMQGAGNRMADADRRSIRDKALYNRMAKDANTAGDYALYQRAAQGYNKTVSDYATNYSQAQSDYWDAAKTEQPGYYYAQTMSAEEVDKRLEELRATKEKVHENLMRVLSDIDNNPHTQEERLQLSDTKYRIQDRYTKINNEIDYLETAKGLHKQMRGNEMYNYWLNEGGLEQPENYAKVEQGKAKYQADRLAASGGMKEPEIATPAGGAIKAYRDRNQKENKWDSIFDNAPNLTPSDEMVFYALYADDPEQAMEWAYYINNRRNSEFQGEIAAWGKEHPIPAWFGGLGNRMISGVANIVDQNSAFAQKQSLQSTGLLSGGAQALNEWSGTIDTDIPIIKDLFNGKGAGDFYQLASSIVESGINMAVASYTGDAAKLVGALGTFIMGSSAAAADYNESLQRGLTTAQAQRHALAAGINEAAFEFISLDKVIKADKLAGQLKKVFVDAGIEASEEFCTTVANRVADGYLARTDGYDTQVEQRTKELIALGLSRAEAEAQAEREWRVELINDAIGGFISGGFHAGIEWGGGKVANKIATNQYNETAGVMTDADEIAALQAYADENGIKYNEKALRGMEAVETEESGRQSAAPTTEDGGQQTTVSTETRDADSSPTAQNDNGKTTENKQSRREARQERKSNRATGALQTQVEAHIAKAAHESGLNNAQAFFEQTVSRYGEGIKRTAQNAVAHEARSVFGQAKNQTELNEMYKQTTENVTSKPIKQTLKEVYQTETMRLAYRGDNEALWDALVGPGSGGKLNLEAEITGKDGSTQQVRIASLDAERGKVKLDNGETVALNELQGLDADTKDVIERLDRFDLGDTRALAFHSYLLAAAKGDATDGVRFVMEYALAYDQGRNGVVSLEKATEQSSLPADIVKEAYEHGARQTETWRKDQERRNAEKRAKAKDGATGRKGILDSSRISQEKLDKLSADKKDALRTFELLAEASGVDIRLIAQNADEKGNVRGYQGLYNKDGNYIEIDINAGLNNIFKDLHTGMTAVLGHELTHWMQENAPTEYLAYKKAVLKAIMSTKNGQLRLERMIEAQINQNKREGKEISRSQAEDEIVADASMKRLGDTEFWDAVADNLGEKKADVFAKIKEYISKFFNRVREIIGRASHTSEAAKLIDRVEADVQANLRRLYAEGIGAAMRNSAQTGAETKKEDSSSYSTRPTTDSTGRELSEGQQAYFNDSRARDINGNLLVLYHQTENEFTVFDPRHEGAGTRDQQTPFGIFLKSSDRDIGIKGKKQMALYANITKPLVALNRESLESKLRDLFPKYANLSDQHQALDREYKQKHEQAKQAFTDYVTTWREQHPNAGRSEIYQDADFDRLWNAEDEVIEEWEQKARELETETKEVLTNALEAAGYDGIFLGSDTGSWGRSTDAYIALHPEQVKNVDNLNPTENPDIRLSTRDTSLPSDLDLALSAADEIVAGGGDEYWTSLLESDPGIAGEAEEIKRLGKQLKKTEADLAEARRNLTLTDRKLKTRGIASLAATIMQDQKAGDVNHNDVQKQITAVLTEAYQKALDQLDAGADVSDAWETVYQEGVVKAADILLTDATHSEKISYKWYSKTLGEYLGEGAREYVEADIAARVAQDFDANRYRPGQKGTVADRLVAQAENRVNKKLDAAKTENAALKAENAKLSEDKAFYKEQAETAKATAGELYQQLLDKREELKSNKKISEDERKATLKKLDNMTRQMQAKRREAEVWKSKSEIGWKAANKAVQEKQAAVDKLEKQLQREQDILSGKLKPPAIQKMLKAAREREAEQVAQQKDERFAKYKEGKKASDLRKRIKNLSDDMKRTMVKPTDGSYVPASLYGSMTKLADALDDFLAPNDGTKAASRYRAVMDKIHALSSEYQAVATLDDPVYSSEYDEEIQHEINELVRTLQGANADEVGTINMTPAKARELSVDELQKVYDIMKYINYCMKTAKSMMASGTFRSVYDAMGQIAEQQQGMTSLNRLGWYSKKKRLRMLDSLSVMRAVEMMSGWERSAALYQLMQQIENGVDVSNSWVMEYNKALQTLKTGKNEKAYRDALTKKLDYSVTDEEGLPVLMTKMQALQLLMTAEREAHNDKLVHLQKGGATIRDALAIQDGKKNVKSQNIKVTPELIHRIQDSLSDWDKAYIKTVRDYFQREGKTTNSVMYKLKHRVLQTEEYYTPYVVDKNYLDTNLDEKQAMSMWVKAPGSTNALETKASQPVIIDGMDTVMAKHVREIADYIGLALPIRDFSKVYNGRLKQGEGEKPLPVKQTIGKNFGEKGQHLLTQSIIDVQGGSRSASWSTAIAEHLNALQSAFVKSALLVNPSVTIKQAASYVAAGSILSHTALDRANHPISVKTDESHAFDPATGLIGHIFFAPNGATATRIYNEIDKHTSLHYQRRLGMSQAELANEANRSGKVRRAMNSVGASMEQNVFGHAARKVGASLNPVSWIQRMDVATTATLWLACKEQARMDDGMKVGTEEYWNHVTELYERVIRETQPMYDSLHRNAGQKSRENSLMQYLFPFRTVPIQNHGQIAASYETLQTALKSKDEARIKEAKKFFAKTMWAQTESAVIFSLMSFIAAALKRKTKKYRDEDEEISLESVLRGIGSDTAGTMFSNFFPLFGSAIWDSAGNIYDSVKTGKKVWSYDAYSVGVVDLMNEFAKAGESLVTDAANMIVGKDVGWDKLRGDILDTLVKSLKCIGIPASTIKTYTEGFAGNLQDLKEGRIPALNDASWERSAAVNANRYLKAWIADNDAKLDTVKAEMMGNYAEAGKNEEEANKALKTKLTATAKDAFVSGTLDKADAILFLVDTGYYDEDEAWNKVRQWEAENEHEGDEDYKWNQYEDLRAAFDTGTGIEEAIKELEDHGYSDTQLANEISDNIRDALNTGAISEETAIDYLKRYRDMDEDKAWKKVQEWQAKAEHADEEDYSYSKYDPIDDAIAANNDIKTIVSDMIAHGEDKTNINKHIKETLVNAYVTGESSEMKLKNQLSRYLGIIGADANEIVDSANKKIRYNKLTSSHPNLDISESLANSWYDGTTKSRENGHESAKAAGMSIEAYLNAKATLDAIKDSNDNGTGEDEVIAAIAKMNLTARQKDALYYERYKGGARKGIYKTW